MWIVLRVNCRFSSLSSRFGVSRIKEAAVAGALTSVQVVLWKKANRKVFSSPIFGHAAIQTQGSRKCDNPWDPVRLRKARGGQVAKEKVECSHHNQGLVSWSNLDWTHHEIRLLETCIHIHSPSMYLLKWVQIYCKILSHPWLLW